MSLAMSAPYLDPDDPGVGLLPGHANVVPAVGGIHHVVVSAHVLLDPSWRSVGVISVPHAKEGKLVADQELEPVPI